MKVCNQRPEQEKSMKELETIHADEAKGPDSIASLTAHQTQSKK